jgi:hypothetical protein
MVEQLGLVWATSRQPKRLLEGSRWNTDELRPTLSIVVVVVVVVVVSLDVACKVTQYEYLY